MTLTICLLGQERVYLSLRKVADTPFRIQGNDYFILIGGKVTFLMEVSAS